MKSLEALVRHQKSTLLITHDVLSAGQSGSTSKNDFMPSTNESSTEANATAGGVAKSSDERLQRFRFKTRYHLNVENQTNMGQLIDISINLEPQESSSKPHPTPEHAMLLQDSDDPGKKPVLDPSPVEQEQKFRYRIFADWQTSYLWYDLSWPGNPAKEYKVEEEVIEERYPDLFPFFTEWVETFETEYYDREFGPHANGSTLSPSQTVAWEISGFFMCCWLALQHDVDSVEYIAGKKYEIRSDGMEAELKQILYDKEAELKHKEEK